MGEEFLAGAVGTNTFTPAPLCDGTVTLWETNILYGARQRISDRRREEANSRLHVYYRVRYRGTPLAETLRPSRPPVTYIPTTYT